MAITLITGGARSGKSLYAEKLALGGASGSPVYIATAQPPEAWGDSEMSARIASHQARRDTRWRNYEEPLDLTGILQKTDGEGARLVDCLTLWLANLMEAERDWRQEGRNLADCLKNQTSAVVLVTNEVGLGIVPDNALARRFCDSAGALNQMIASAADEVYLMVSGLPLKVK
ncbi:bifunctional adenosylcobinamide kinase/adenosylcobinamide-phosphate guanylyltransferase [Aureimonas fodinaquatilis]|uniref:Bifunctional adenosylcobalamin biosynthesis protein n=1 Tax=Aureimonas fodinaquatilis TaxID=2565783 RepID=A0A5B0DSW3_9HYPH|nr:bifunctional adenosylcobinamide kinase/adenosylcobinamide-phosphate guanylyltransferase [Aureimonas fodinaquatilis]KAA0969556.1 bifunctional adenosylcobinamide kinase/adenosylcobinamide-phosphate guanylyltransferase [Aureimonas fodinaquatilis]